MEYLQWFDANKKNRISVSYFFDNTLRTIVTITIKKQFQVMSMDGINMHHQNYFGILGNH